MVEYRAQPRLSSGAAKFRRRGIQSGGHLKDVIVLVIEHHFVLTANLRKLTLIEGADGYKEQKHGFTEGNEGRCIRG